MKRLLAAALAVSIASACAEKPYEFEEPPAAATPEADLTETAPAATETSEATPTAETTPADEEGESMAMPADALDECRADRVLAPACPSRLPLLEDVPFQRSKLDKLGGATLFNLEWNAPYPGLVAKNAPPRFLHLIVQTGDIEKFLPFEWPKPAPRPTGPIPKKRNDALFVDEVKWRGIGGELALAPAFPVGGINGDHLMFRWRTGNNQYVLSVHAWDDLTETESVLEALFASTRFAGP